MGLGEAILAVGAGARPASFEQFAAAIDPQWIDDALAATGTASVRRRKLPAERVVWLVLGMALFEDRSIAEVVHHLDLVLPAPGGGRGRISNAAIVQARDQPSAAPLAALFAQTASAWAPPAADEARWRGLAVYALDGTTLRVPDTPDNVAAFGRPPSRYGEGAGYPQLRLVALLAVRHHLLAGAAFGPYRTSEGELATTVWEKIPDHAVVTLDRASPATRSSMPSRMRSTSATGWCGPAAAAPRSSGTSCSGSARATRSLSCVLVTPRVRRTPISRPRCAFGPSACITAASAPTCSSPRCSTPRSTRPPNSPPSTTSAGNSNSPSMS